MNTKQPVYGPIKSARELGDRLRSFRKQQNQTLEKVSALSRLSTKFLSELERGKETAELGKVLVALQRVGLEVIIQPRGHSNVQSKPQATKK